MEKRYGVIGNPVVEIETNQDVEKVVNKIEELIAEDGGVPYPASSEPMLKKVATNLLNYFAKTSKLNANAVLDYLQEQYEDSDIFKIQWLEANAQDWLSDFERNKKYDNKYLIMAQRLYDKIIGGCPICKGHTFILNEDKTYTTCKCKKEYYDTEAKLDGIPEKYKIKEVK